MPAEEAVVGLTDRIFTRVATTEAAAVPASAFMIDMSQMSAMLRHATPRCSTHHCMHADHQGCLLSS